MGYFRRHAVDLEKSVNFYTEILGLNVTTVRPGGMMVFMSARGNASHELALIDAKGAPEDAREKGIG
ncbi:MAG: VOC family protein, partial [Dehalococcoidia bacterium]|nr:VOC family protein [Dehalococcoidia bacterium]